MTVLPEPTPTATAAGQATNPLLTQAARDAVEAADNSQQIQLITAILQAQAIAQAVQPQPVAYQQRQPAQVGKWVAIGCAVCVGSIGLALGALAVAIAAVCATGCLVVLRSMWRQYMSDKH